MTALRRYSQLASLIAMRIALLTFSVLFSATVMATDSVYRWVDSKGVVHYGAQPPTKDALPANLPEIQTYSHRAGNKALPIAPVEASAKPELAAVSVKEVRILTPVQDEVFRDPQGAVGVAVAVLPALPAGAGVVFYLDGAAKNLKPSPTTSTVFNGVERGEHSVTAAVVDATGKELMRTLPVTFHNKPPVVTPPAIVQSKPPKTK